MTRLAPRVVAAELGLVLPGGTPISWDVLLDLAVRRYWERVAIRPDVMSGGIVCEQRAKPPPGRTGNGLQARPVSLDLTETT